MEKARTIFWLVGENSGDLHAALVMESLNRHMPKLKHVGIGGPRMQQQGLKTMFPFDRFAVMGFVEVVQHLGFFMKVQRKIKSYLAKEKPDLAILVDYPGMNLRVAFMADEQRVPVLYFICPQFWAWKHERVYKLKESTRHVACILPFEREMLEIHNVNCSYVGHPIAEEVKYEMDRDAFAHFYGLDSNKKWIGFFPGSRNHEITKMLPIFLEAARRWPESEYEMLFSKTRGVKHQEYMNLLGARPTRNVKVVDGNNYEMMKYCELLVCTSGTVTLEAAYIGTPLIICYKASPISYLLGRYFVKIKRIGLPNIVLDKDLLPELIQGEMTAGNIYQKANAILSNPELSKNIRKELYHLRAMLSDKKPSQELPLIVKKLFETYG